MNIGTPAELSAGPCRTLPNQAKSYQKFPRIVTYLCRTWWITRIWHTHLARNDPKFTRICTYIALRSQKFSQTQDDTFWLVFWGPAQVQSITGVQKRDRQIYGAVHPVTAKLEQWLCCTATCQIVRDIYLLDDCFSPQNGQITSATGWLWLKYYIWKGFGPSMNIIMIIVVPPWCQCITLIRR